MSSGDTSVPTLSTRTRAHEYALVLASPICTERSEGEDLGEGLSEGEAG